MEVERLTGIIAKASETLNPTTEAPAPANDTGVPNNYMSAREYLRSTGKNYSVRGLSRAALTLSRRLGLDIYVDYNGDNLYEIDVLEVAERRCTSLVRTK